MAVRAHRLKAGCSFMLKDTPGSKCILSDHVTTLAHSPLVPQESGLKSVNLGENVTLTCTRKNDEAIYFYWYKETLGQKPKLISTFSGYDDNAILHNDFKENPERFIIQAENDWNNLKILDLRYSDSATYHCIGTHEYGFGFKEEVSLHVKSSGSVTQDIVHQSVSEWVEPGENVTLNCTVHTETCDGEVNVYSFTNSGESHPGVIYTNGVKNTHCERRAETKTLTCFYNLTKNNLTSSDAGTYYCAVVSCGEILFGNGTKISFKKESLFLVYFMGMVLGFTSVLAVVLSYCVLKMRRRKCRHCPEPDSQQRGFDVTTGNIGQVNKSLQYFPTTQPPHADTENQVTICGIKLTEWINFMMYAVKDQDADNLQYAAVNIRKTNRPSRQRDNSNEQCVYTTCVYSSLRQ
ncbi:uncharacterized protein LOC130130453 [Lampris incognitus]|uniref:uncharacterized protein LOC130130453 n=1 Tax=Lampris incognitus TaxID=2546036 RepID=UPI0024B4B692|nr:uncharacterized protein LOC130130453 [Lampris incognitus]